MQLTPPLIAHLILFSLRCRSKDPKRSGDLVLPRARRLDLRVSQVGPYPGVKSTPPWLVLTNGGPMKAGPD